MLPTRGIHVAQTIQKSLRSASRNYAAAAVPLTDPLELDPQAGRQIAPGDVQISKLENGIKVASVDNGGAISRISIAIENGSRHETASQLGLSHLFKNAAFLSNKDRTALRTVRELQQVGGSLESCSTREMFTRNLSFMRNRLPEMMENVAPGITQPLYNSWDVNDIKNVCASENAKVALDESAVNLELLHRVAFRNGLGNSIYCDDLRIGNFTPQHFEEYAQQLHVGERLTVVGCDVSHDELVRYVKDLLGALPRGQKVQSSPQKYFGGEVHLNTANGLTHASLVAEGAGLFHAKLPAVSVFQRVLGAGPYIKWGSNQVSSRLNKSAASVTDGPLLINALNVSYSDAGLCGFHAITSPQAAIPVMKAAVSNISSISKGDITADDFERAKTQAKAGITMLGEQKEDFVEDLMKQIAFNGTYTSIQESLDKIDQVTVEQVTEVAKGLLAGKASLAVTGDTSCAPYIDQLLN